MPQNTQAWIRADARLESLRRPSPHEKLRAWWWLVQWWRQDHNLPPPMIFSNEAGQVEFEWHQDGRSLMLTLSPAEEGSIDLGFVEYGLCGTGLVDTEGKLPLAEVPSLLRRVISNNPAGDQA